MLLSDIQTAIFTRAVDASDLVPLILDRKGDGHFEDNDKPFCKLSIIPLENSEPVYCNSVMRSGFILANVYAPNGHGVNDATIEAEKFVALYSEGLTFDGITIPDTGDVKGSLTSEHKGWFYVSALIYFKAK